MTPDSSSRSSGMQDALDPSLRIELFPADLERSFAFYAKLGFTERGRSEFYGAMKLGSVHIGFLQAEAVDPSRRAFPAMTEIVIEVNDVDAFCAGIIARGLTPAEPLTDREWGLRDFRIFDPDGYYLRFTNRR